jgi:hypothetical protein
VPGWHLQGDCAGLAALQDGPSTATHKLTIRSGIDLSNFTEEATQAIEDQLGLDKTQRRDVPHRPTGLRFDVKDTGKLDETTRTGRLLRRHDGGLFRARNWCRKKVHLIQTKGAPRDRLFRCSNQTISTQSRRRRPANMKSARCEFTDGIHKQKTKRTIETKQGPCCIQYEARVSIRGIAPVHPIRRVPPHLCRS